MCVLESKASRFSSETSPVIVNRFSHPLFVMSVCIASKSPLIFRPSYTTDPGKFPWHIQKIERFELANHNYTRD